MTKSGPAPEPAGEAEAPDEAALSATKARDTALALPLAGLVALSPPLIDVFAVEGRIFGAPGIVVYLFVVWAALICLAGLLSRRLASEGAKGGGEP
ncbi:MAG: hypothetical protein AAF360_15040 [Pseudomonadota bacterium]